MLTGEHWLCGLAVLGLSRYGVKWLKALIFTLAIEVSLGALLTRGAGSAARRCAVLLAASLFTHPWVWFVFPYLGLSYLPAMILAELFAVGVEAALYYAVLRPRRLGWALLLSLVLNASSLGLGLLVRYTLGWV